MQFLNAFRIKVRNLYQSPVWDRIVNVFLLACAFYLSLEVFNWNLDFTGQNHLTTHVRRFCDALVLSIPSLFIRRKSILFPYILLISALLYSNLIYYRNYGTLIPLTSYVLVDQVSEVGESVLNSIFWKDILFFLPLVAFSVWYALTGRHGRITPPDCQNSMCQLLACA